MFGRFREGDVVETVDNVLFDVKGQVHPPHKVIAFIRFFQDPAGDRTRGGTTYRKIYALSERYALLKKAFPQYLAFDPVFDTHLCQVPVEAITHHYQPNNCLRLLRQRSKLDELEKLALLFLKLLRETEKVSWTSLGISGSIMVKLHSPVSDIDPVVYGSESCCRVYLALKSLLKKKEGLVRPYDLNDLRKLFDFRSKDTAISFEDFVRTESRKFAQGKFMGRDYFFRFVKNWNEIEFRYGDVHYVSEGYTKISARIVDDSDMIFTPCCYKIDDIDIVEGVVFEPIKEIVSFRGRFCEQARNGERVIVQGKVEGVQREGEPKYYRLLLGNKHTDYMILADE